MIGIKKHTEKLLEGARTFFSSMDLKTATKTTIYCES